MSLVGNLEDLSLGDIMQIISLSQKTGVLALHSAAHGSGRIVFRSGMVAAATLAGRAEPEANEEARQSDVEAIVLQMFTWQAGDFSFDLRREADPEDPGFELEMGLNAQYLAMEGMRVRDEQARQAEQEPVPDAAAPAQDDPFADWNFADEAEDEAEEEGEKPEPPLAVAPAKRRSRPLILIDPDSKFVGWAKDAFGTAFTQVHVFQQAEQGLSRIRQYLIRGQFPIVLISSVIEIDPLCGIHGVSDFVRRLKTQAPRLPIYSLVEEAEEGESQAVPPAGMFDGSLMRPGRRRLLESARTKEAGLASGFVSQLLAQLDAPVENGPTS